VREVNLNENSPICLPDSVCLSFLGLTNLPEATVSGYSI
jgi:hypothetical protein